MFLGHKYTPETGEVITLTDGLEVSKYYSIINKTSTYHNEQNTDSWERFFTLTELQHENGEDVSDKCDLMCNMMSIFILIRFFHKVNTFIHNSRKNSRHNPYGRINRRSGGPGGRC